MPLSFKRFVLTTSAVTLTTVNLSYSVLAEDTIPTKFRCVLSSDVPSVPMTIASSAWNEAHPIIRWVSNSFIKSGYSQERRCKEVTTKLNSYYACGLLEEDLVNSVRDISTLVAGPLKKSSNNYPAILATVNSEVLSRKNCGEIRNEILEGTKDKVLLFMLERGDSPERVIEQINSIRDGDEDPVCDSNPATRGGACNPELK